MTGKLLPLLAGSAIFAGLQTGCEQHPASQTVPGYNERKTKEQQVLEKESRTPIVPAPSASKQ